MLEELLASEVTLLDALLSKTIYHLSFGSDRCVVCTRHPTSILSVNASLADEDVLDSIIEHVSHVKHTCYVRWWDNNSVRFTSIRLACKELMIKPVLIPFAFNV